MGATRRTWSSLLWTRGTPADSYICYSHVLRALPPDVIAAVRDLVRVVTPETPGAYICLKQSLLSRYTQTDIAKWFPFIDHPPLGDRHVLTLFSDMQALLPADANTLFNAHFLRRLLESMQNALVGKGELPPRELAEAAALLPHPALAAAVPVHQTVPLPPSPPPLIAQARPPFRRSQSRSPPVAVFRQPPLSAARPGHPRLGWLAASCPNRRRPPPTASITTTSAVELAGASPPVAGIRETSDCPAGYLHFAIAVRGRPHLSQGQCFPHKLSC